MGEATSSSKLVLKIMEENKKSEQEASAYQERDRRTKYFWLFVVGILLFLSFEIGFERGKKDESIFNVNQGTPLSDSVVINKDLSKEKQEVDFSLFWRVWDLVNEKFVDADNLKAEKLLYGAIQGMLQATGDPYTIFFDPRASNEFDEEISGTFEGIGAEIGIRNDILTIVAPLDGSPAEKAGLRAGDKIIKIEGESTLDLNIEEAIERIRGEKGTEVSFVVFRNGGVEETIEIAVTRDVIKIDSVVFEQKEENISYIRINRFGEDTVYEFNRVAQKIPSNSGGIILDLRNNPGGFLDASIDIASRMLPRGEVVVIEEDRDKKQKKLYSKGGDLLSGIRTIILINQGSASASEILAGALRENRDNVTIVGEKSFGKGSVQELISLPQKSSTKITVAKWLTPEGKQINNEGIAPDEEVELTNDDFENERDPQLDRALELLKK